MKTIYSFLAMVIFTAMVIGCDDGGGCNGARTIALDQSDNGATVKMTHADQIEVTLKSNQTTGFVWENVLTEGSIIVQQGDPVYTVDPFCPAPDGCGGTVLFTFKAVETGTGKIKLIYHQPFTDMDPHSVFEVTVEVR